MTGCVLHDVKVNPCDALIPDPACAKMRLSRVMQSVCDVAVCDATGMRDAERIMLPLPPWLAGAGIGSRDVPSGRAGVDALFSCRMAHCCGIHVRCQPEKRRNQFCAVGKHEKYR